MTLADQPTTRKGSGGTPVRIGLLRLSDAAPVIVGKENGFYAAQGLDVRLSVEPSWANIADKLSYGQLDAAVVLPPLVFAVTLGLRGVGTPLIVPMSVSLNGLAVAVGPRMAEELGTGGTPLEIGRRLAGLLPPARPRPRIAIAHSFSTHNLLLRYWLVASGIDPDRDVELIVVPPADTVRAMQDGHIDGFCAGPPWPDVATRLGVAQTLVTSYDIWHNHPEKCLAVRREWAEANPEILEKLVAGTLQAARFCDAPANADGIATILAQDNYMAVDRASVRASLPSDEPGAKRSVFFANAANFPWRSHAAWFLAGMAKWGYLGQDVDRAALADQVYRPDLFRAAATRIGLAVPTADRKIEGAHDAPWSLDADPLAIPMQPDSFCDSGRFESAR
jgi:NitT/TauT family transport system ATP-binding protein/nitrate/nitrite transport system substrate-binding protein